MSGGSPNHEVQHPKSSSPQSRPLARLSWGSARGRTSGGSVRVRPSGGSVWSGAHDPRTTQRKISFPQIRASFSDGTDGSAARRETLASVYAETAAPRQAFFFQKVRGNMMSSWSALRRRIANLISDPSFDAGIGLIIVLNAVVIGLEVDMDDRIDTRFFRVAELIFVVIFTIEVSLRLYVFRLTFFKSIVHNLDLVIVIFGLVAIILLPRYDRNNQNVAVHKQMRTASVFRVTRLLRIVRVLRLSTQFQALWMIVQGLIASIGTVLWTALLLSGVTYFFGVLACDFVATDKELQKVMYDVVNKKTVLDRFRTLPRSFLTLIDFFALDNISSKAYDIIIVRPLLIVFFLAFALIVPIVLLNLITAALVDMALRSSASDREHGRAVALADWEERVDELKQLFFKITGATDLEHACSQKTSQKTLALAIANGFSRKGSMTPKPDIDEEVEVPKLSKELLMSMCELKEVREHLNLLFGEPRKSKKGMHRLLDLWVVLDLDEDEEISLDEFTEGIGRLYDVIHSAHADAFVMLRLVKLHYMARRERVDAARKGRAERNTLHSDLTDRMDAMDRKLEVLLDTLPQVPEGRMETVPAQLPCEDSKLKMSL